MSDYTLAHIVLPIVIGYALGVTQQLVRLWRRKNG